MEKEYPYHAEYAKSSRSNCRGCKTNISQDSLRLATYVQSPFFDGKMTTWYHFKCFFTKNRKIKNIDEIKNFDTLRWDDQEKIKNQIIDVAGKDVEVFNFSIEYTKSKKVKCVICNLIIEKGMIKITYKEVENSKKKGFQWYHVDCFHELKNDILKKIPAFDYTKFSGLEMLTDVDRDEIAEKFKNWKTKKRIAQNAVQECPPTKISKEDTAFETELKNQNDLIWQLRDQLQKQLPKTVIVSLLEYNKQYVPSGESNLLTVLSDRMVFGCISQCPECGGIMTCNSTNYNCKSHVNEWTKCLHETREVERSEFVIPIDYQEYNVLKDYHYVKRTRILPKESIAAPEPLKGYSFLIDKVTFKGGCTSAIIRKKISDLGGTVVNVGHESNHNYAALISIDHTTSKRSLRSIAKERNIDVVTPEFLDNLETEDFFDALKKYSCVDWGRSKEELRDLKNNNQKYSERLYDDDEKIKMLTVKEGGVVDADSGLEHKAHIYRDSRTNDPLNAVLGMVDLVRGSNSFYKLQLLESDTKKKWWVFRSWGRIGTTIGGNKKENFSNIKDALANYEEIYLDKTGNDWNNRHKFQKHPYKFYPMDVDYGDDITAMELSIADQPSKLPNPVRQLMEFILDVNSMKKAMLEFEIDLKKMPLGKLSKKQIDMSYAVLSELQQLLVGSEVPSKSKLLDCSTRFYTLLPHDFGMRAPPLIDSIDVIKKKCEMIENLREIEVAFKMLKTGGDVSKIDNCYDQLHNSINVVEKDTEIFNRISLYLKNTHAKTHSNYKLEIIDIFDLAREDEDTRFLEFSNLPNHMMLWHGSRRTNWAGILSQGLRIAPPEAPVTGYMFGKGIYFADMVSKSANYCFTNSSEPEGMLLLCEVALGTISERTDADENIVLKEGEHSCLGVGGTYPDPRKNIVDDDGVVYPLGTPMKRTNHKGGLQYNEYIVYNVGQVKQRYLLRVQFKYSSRR